MAPQFNRSLIPQWLATQWKLFNKLTSRVLHRPSYLTPSLSATKPREEHNEWTLPLRARFTEDIQQEGILPKGIQHPLHAPIKEQSKSESKVKRPPNPYPGATVTPKHEPLKQPPPRVELNRPTVVGPVRWQPIPFKRSRVLLRQLLLPILQVIAETRLPVHEHGSRTGAPIKLRKPADAIAFLLQSLGVFRLPKPWEIPSQDMLKCINRPPNTPTLAPKWTPKWPTLPLLNMSPVLPQFKVRKQSVTLLLFRMATLQPREKVLPHNMLP